MKLFLEILALVSVVECHGHAKSDPFKSSYAFRGLKNNKLRQLHSFEPAKKWTATVKACIAGHNDKEITGPSFEECKILCERETSFFCASVDYYPPEKICQLSTDDNRNEDYMEPCYQPYTDSNIYSQIIHGKRCKKSKKCQRRNGECIPIKYWGNCNGILNERLCGGKDCACCISKDISQFKEFVSNYNLEFDSKEEQIKRQTIFYQNLRKIENHNRLYDAGTVGYKMGVNQFSHLAYEEFVSKYTGGNEPTETLRQATYYQPIDPAFLPASIDWRNEEVLNPIQNQGGCGSCWAFAAASAIESQIKRESGVLQKLSEQYLVDCDNLDNGCKGGNPSRAFTYVKENGIALESGYPYTSGHTGQDGTCNQNAPKTTYKVISQQAIRPGNDTDLMNANVHIGPVSVLIHAGVNLMFYKEGVFDDPWCSNGVVNHAVVLAGYDEESWIIRNSWGTGWGQGGYGMISRATPNNCWISSYALFPIVLKGCEFNGRIYQDGEYNTETCMKLQCSNSNWIYTGEHNPECGHCHIWGDPHIVPYDIHTILPSNNQYDDYDIGLYTISQKGLASPASLRISADFEVCNPDRWGDNTCVKTAYYHDPGTKVEINLAEEWASADYCNKPNPSDDPKCAMRVTINDEEKFVDDYSTVSASYEKDGVLIFKPKCQDLECQLSLVGKYGFSVSIIQELTSNYYIDIYAMPELKSTLYGLCDTFTGASTNSFTKQDGTKIYSSNKADMEEFTQSWKIKDLEQEGSFPARNIIDPIIPFKQSMNSSSFSQFEKQCIDITQEVCSLVEPYMCTNFIETCILDMNRTSDIDKFIEDFTYYINDYSHISNKET